MSKHTKGSAPSMQAALDSIIEILSGREWTADTAPEIADVLRAAGYEIADYEPHQAGCICQDCAGEA